MKLKELSEWFSEFGVSPPPWKTKNYVDMCNILSKIMSEELLKKCDDDNDDETKSVIKENNDSYKVSFNDLLRIAEELLGIPQLVVENDLVSKSNLQLALLTYSLSMKFSLNGIDTKAIRDTPEPKLIYEAAKMGEMMIPDCKRCNKHVYLIERTIADDKIYHRQCFSCCICKNQLYRGCYRLNDQGNVECIHHFIFNILSKFPNKNPNGSQNDSISQKFLLPRIEAVKIPPPRPPPPKIIPKDNQTIEEKVEKKLKIDESNNNPFDDESDEPQKSEKNISSEDSSPNTKKVQRVSPFVVKKNEEKYPGSLNPFDSDEDTETSEDDYDDSLNPFSAEDDPLENKKPDTTKDIQNTPPPKPPRRSIVQDTPINLVQASTNVLTLPRAKKTYRAPPPPMSVRRHIEFTEKKSYESIDEIVDDLKKLYIEHNIVDTNGKEIEKAILTQFTKNTFTFSKNKNVKAWIKMLEEKCAIVRKEAILIHKWVEKILNEAHEDTEYQLRLLTETSNGNEKSSLEQELLDVLVDIMKLKNGMIETDFKNNQLRGPDEPTKASKIKLKSFKKQFLKLKK